MNPLLELVRFQLADFLPLQFDSELVPDPLDRAAPARVLGEEQLAGGKVDAGDGFAAALPEQFRHACASRLLQIAVAEVQAPAGIGQRGDRRPVPVLPRRAAIRGLRGRVRQVLGEGLLDLEFREPCRRIPGESFGLREVHPAQVVAVQADPQAGTGPLGEGVDAEVAIQEPGQMAIDLAVDGGQDQRAAIGPVQDPLPVAVDVLPLLVQDRVVFEQLLAGRELPLFQILLGGCEAAGHHPARDGVALLQAELVEDLPAPVARESPQQIVFQREKEPAAAGLSPAAAQIAQLPVLAARLVPFRADHVQPADAPDVLALRLHPVRPFELPHQGVPFVARHIQAGGILGLQPVPGQRRGVASQHDAVPAASQVGGDGHSAQPPDPGDDRGVAGLVLGVEAPVLDPAAGQHFGQPFAVLARSGADQDRAPLALDLADPAARDPLFHRGIARLELDGVLLLPDKLPLLDAAVPPDEHVPAVQPLGFVRDGFEFLPLRPVDEIGKLQAAERPVGRDRHDLQPVDLPELLGLGLGPGRARQAAELLVQPEEVLQRDRGQGLRRRLRLGRLGIVRGGRSGDDQRRPGLVDQDAVHVIDDRVVQAALSLLQVLGIAVVAAGRGPHVVAEIVEAEFVVRAVGDVAGVGLLPLQRRHLRPERPHREAQSPIQRAHPVPVPAGQIVADGDHVDALAFQCVQVGRQGGHQRLPFARDHFGNRPAVQQHAADQLDVEVPQAEEPPPGLAANGKRFDQQVVQRLSRPQPLAKPGGLLLEFDIGQRLARGSSSWIASTRDCSRRRSRVVAEPKTDVTPCSTPRNRPRTSRPTSFQVRSSACMVHN